MSGFSGPRKLGKRAPLLDGRTLKLEKYVSALSPPPPSAFYQGKVSSWPMYLNDQLGDCVIAAAGHMIEQWTEYAGAGYLPTDDQMLTAYEQIGGYVAGDPSTDNGCSMLTALNTWRQTGIAGHKIIAYVSLRVGNLEELRQAVVLFGNAFVGIQLPLTAQNQSQWEVVSATGDGAPGSWGGHCVPIVGYDPNLNSCVSWGSLLNMTKAFYEAYSDEAYAVLSQGWIENNSKSPSGFDVAQLQAALALVAAADPAHSKSQARTRAKHK